MIAKNMLNPERKIFATSATSAIKNKYPNFAFKKAQPDFKKLKP